jgi:hypothetical protein
VIATMLMVNRREGSGRRVPFLFTIDVHRRRNLQEEIRASLDELARANIVATFFLPAELIEECHLGVIIRRIGAAGHQVACHGLLHRAPENFREDPMERQIECLRHAKDLIEQASGREVTAFRAPGFIVSANTMLALEACGYRADLSVNSQRFALLSSQIDNVQWLTATRGPYHPSRGNPYRPGNLDLWEIPLTALGLPFTSTLYQTLGLRFTRAFARAMIAEARFCRERPVVYMAHPEEFHPSEHRRPRTYYLGHDPDPFGFFFWKLVIPLKNEGFRLRYFFYETDEGRIFANTLQFIRFLGEQRGLEFLRVDDYLVRLEAAAARDSELCPVKT